VLIEIILWFAKKSYHYFWNFTQVIDQTKIGNTRCFFLHEQGAIGCL